MSLTLKSNQSLVDVRGIVRSYSQFLEALDTPVALAVKIQLDAGHFDDIVTRKIDPKDYQQLLPFRLDYQAVSGLKKAAFLETSIDRQAAALKTFWDAEAKCRETNKRLNDLMDGKLNIDSKIFATLERAVKLIKQILGPVPQALNFKFGPGVTSYVKKHVTLPKKYSSEIDVTPQLFCNLLDIIGPVWARELKTVNLVKGCKIAFVPKDAKTDRTIGIEPHISGYVQLGIGGYLRERFRPWVNLDTGQEVNRFLASVADDWRLATVDLKSASDTISRALIWYLLPEEWAMLLDKCRSQHFTLTGDQQLHEFEKFSSMGNGFTFELESIIFYALARACGSNRHLTAVYGDDIICEAAVFEHLQEVLNMCGFTVNWDKSFCRSAFYESCGSDFFNGVNVRPFMWKENKPSLLFKMANDVSRFARLDNGGRDERYRKCHQSITKRLKPYGLQLSIPDGVGDIGFITDFDVAVPNVRRLPNGWCGFSFKALKYRPLTLDHSCQMRGLLSDLDSGRTDDWSSRLFPDEGRQAARSVVRKTGVYQVGRITSFGEWNGHGAWVKPG